MAHLGQILISWSVTFLATVLKKNGYNNVYMFQLLATKVQDKVQTCSDNLGICNNI